MTQNNGEPDRQAPDPERNVIEHGEGKSLTGSAQAIGLEPTQDFVPPTMALDSIDPEPTTD